MRLPVRLLPRAKSDFRQIYAYIKKRSPGGADRWRDAFEKAIDRIASQPRQAGLAPEDPLTHFELRQVLFKTRRGLTYRAVFTILDDELVVLRVRGPGQPPLSTAEMPAE